MVSGFANRKEVCAICKYWSLVNSTNYDPKSQRFDYDPHTKGDCSMKKMGMYGSNCGRYFQKDFRFL